MLIIFFGVSCVGKTTLIWELKTNFGWFCIPTYMTRPLRTGETEKISVSHDSFSQMESNCHFICVNNFFGNKYGTPKKEVERAIESVDEYWVLDFSITKKHLLDNYHHVSFVILPENEEQLVNHIIKSNRLDRLDYILEEFKHNYIKYYKLASNDSSNIIINIHSEINETSKKIHSVVENIKHEYFK